MADYVPLEYNFFLVPICIVLIHLFVVWRTKSTKRNLVEHRVSFFTALAFLILILDTIIVTAYFQNHIIAMLVGYPIGIFFVILIDIYNVNLIKKSNIEIQKSNDKSERVIMESQDVAINLANIATELAASASEVNAASEEIASTTEEISVSALNQVNSFTTIKQKASRISQLSGAIEASTGDINKIMEIIIGISEQTNLLALNASIEAGRAGEYGRGFAVVADEVRKLAEESKNTVHNTDEKVSVITDKIAASTNLILEITRDIEAAILESQENANGMQNVSAAAEEQTASMEEVTSTANRLGNISEDLRSKLVNFSNKRMQKTTGIIQK